MTQLTLYQSTDASAPTLSGTVNDLVNLLNKVLVTGYGTKAAAGWTSPFTAANKAVYRQGTPTASGASSQQFYLDVDDSGPGLGGAREARLRGYEAMTAVGTGTGPFPTAAQLAAGIIVRKSTTADAVTRNWIALADARTLYLFIATADTAQVWFGFCFGDYFALDATYPWNVCIMGRAVENSGTSANETMDTVGTGVGLLGSSRTGHYIPRAYSGLGTALPFNKWGAPMNTTAAFLGMGASGWPFPNSPDSSIYLSRVYVTEPTAQPTDTIIGYLRGFYQIMHSVANIAMGFTFGGSGDLAGRTFECIRSTGNSGCYTMETSNTIDTN